MYDIDGTSAGMPVHILCFLNYQTKLEFTTRRFPEIPAVFIRKFERVNPK